MQFSLILTRKKQMTMRKGIMALENLEEVAVVEAPQVDVTDVEQKVEEIEALDVAIDQEADQYEEGAAIAESVDALADNVEKKIESGEAVSENEAELIGIAVENFCKRLDYKKKIMPAMEGFADKDKSLGQSKVALENLNQLSVRLNAQLVIAQEGIFESISKSVEMLFETEDKVLQKLQNASAAYDGKTLKTEPIENPFWGKYLKSDAAVFTGKSALATLAIIEKASSNADVKTSVEELTKCLEKLTKEVKGNWFVSNKFDIERIESIQEKVFEETKNLDELIQSFSKSKAISFEPISAAEKNKLVAAIKAVLADKSLTETLKKAFSKNSRFHLWSAWNKNLRLKNTFSGLVGGVVGAGAGALVGRAVGPLTSIVGHAAGSNVGAKVGLYADAFSAEDIKKANKAAAQAVKALNSIQAIVSVKIKVCSALVSYIESSAA
jgi:hypothetical protein